MNNSINLKHNFKQTNNKVLKNTKNKITITEQKYKKLSEIIKQGIFWNKLKLDYEMKFINE